MFEDAIRRGKQKAREPVRLSPGQSYELQRAASIIESVADLATERNQDKLAHPLYFLIGKLRQIIRAGDAAREQYLRENRDP